MNYMGSYETKCVAKAKALRAKFFPPVKPLVRKNLVDQIEREKEIERINTIALKELLAKYRSHEVDVEEIREQGSAREIVKMVALKHQVSVNDLVKSKRRYKQITHARQEAYFLIVSRLGWSLPQTGRYFGKDHTTVLHGIRTHAKRMVERGEAL
jgi:chromosomal replication initiation ATPase DnaA